MIYYVIYIYIILFLKTKSHIVAIKILLTSKKKSNKKTNQKDPFKMAKFKMTCPRWHFGQIG
jgi:hypothetical protein